MRAVRVKARYLRNSFRSRKGWSQRSRRGWLEKESRVWPLRMKDVSVRKRWRCERNQGGNHVCLEALRFSGRVEAAIPHIVFGVELELPRTVSVAEETSDPIRHQPSDVEWQARIRVHFARRLLSSCRLRSSPTLLSRLIDLLFTLFRERSGSLLLRHPLLPRSKLVSLPVWHLPHQTTTP